MGLRPKPRLVASGGPVPRAAPRGRAVRAAGTGSVASGTGDTLGSAPHPGSSLAGRRRVIRPEEFERRRTAAGRIHRHAAIDTVRMSGPAIKSIKCRPDVGDRGEDDHGARYVRFAAIGACGAINSRRSDVALSAPGDRHVQGEEDRIERRRTAAGRIHRHAAIGTVRVPRTSTRRRGWP